jgi:hypothetical protein
MEYYEKYEDIATVSLGSGWQTRLLPAFSLVHRLQDDSHFFVFPHAKWSTYALKAAEVLQGTLFAFEDTVSILSCTQFEANAESMQQDEINKIIGFIIISMFPFINMLRIWGAGGRIGFPNL